MTRLLILLLFSACAAACGSNSSTSPSSTSSSTAVRSTENFETTLAHGDSSFYSFTASNAGTVTVTLTSVVAQGHLEALSTPLRIGLGTPAGEGCTVTDTVDTPPTLTAQLTVSMTAGIHCVSIADFGQVTGTVIASVRFTHL